jgi:hypothetical protein
MSYDHPRHGDRRHLGRNSQAVTELRSLRSLASRPLTQAFRLCEVLDRGKGQQTVVVKHVTANADDRILGRLGGPESRSARRRLHAALADEGRGLGRRHELEQRPRGIAMIRHRQHTDGEIDVASTADTAAVHVERLSRHEGRVIASQERHRAHEIGRRFWPLNRLHGGSVGVFILHARHACAWNSRKRAGRARKARRDCVDRNPEGRKLARQRPRDADNAGLARHVVYETAHHRTECARCHIDYPSPLALLHGRREGSAHEKHTVQIDRQHPPPVRKRHFIEGLIGKNAGAIDEDVAATKMFSDVARKRLDRLHRGHVACAGERLPAGLLNHAHSVAARSDIGNHNMGSVLSEPLRERLPDTVRPARDDRDFIVVGFGHAVTLRFPCPLIEPDPPNSGIQLSEFTTSARSPSRPGGGAPPAHCPGPLLG